MAKIQNRKENTRYSDFKINMDAHPVTGDLTLNTNEDAIKRSIKNLLFTDYYERPFQPALGAGLKDYLFENIDAITALSIQERIETTIENYEPRARLDFVEVKADPDYNRYNAKIVFTTINNPLPVTLNTILTRIR